MAGAVIRVAPKTFVSFSNVPAGGLQPVLFWLARRIDVSRWRENTLFVRQHGATIINAQAWVLQPRLDVYQDGHTDEDPGVFSTVGGQGGGANQFVSFLTSVTLTPGTNVYSLQPLALPANIGASIAIAVSARQHATTTQQADIPLSVDLSGKE